MVPSYNSLTQTMSLVINKQFADTPLLSFSSSHYINLIDFTIPWSQLRTKSVPATSIEYYMSTMCSATIRHNSYLRRIQKPFPCYVFFVNHGFYVNDILGWRNQWQKCYSVFHLGKKQPIYKQIEIIGYSSSTIHQHLYSQKMTVRFFFTVNISAT